MTSHAISSSPRSQSNEMALFLRILDESYERKAWHGPNLKGSIRGLSAAQAAWRPHANRHSIAANVVHTAYWKYAVRRRLRSEKRGSFRLKGSNWFVLPSPVTEKDWKSYVALLDDEHRLLRQTIASFPPERLPQLPVGGKVSFITQIYGIALHDVYHAGQIQLLKRMQTSGA
jgi:hypothetical protein